MSLRTPRKGGGRTNERVKTAPKPYKPGPAQLDLGHRQWCAKEWPPVLQRPNHVPISSYKANSKKYVRTMNNSTLFKERQVRTGDTALQFQNSRLDTDHVSTHIPPAGIETWYPDRRLTINTQSYLFGEPPAEIVKKRQVTHRNPITWTQKDYDIVRVTDNIDRDQMDTNLTICFHPRFDHFHKQQTNKSKKIFNRVPGLCSTFADEAHKCQKKMHDR